jgi:hypothetical protein
LIGNGQGHRPMAAWRTQRECSGAAWTSRRCRRSGGGGAEAEDGIWRWVLTADEVRWGALAKYLSPSRCAGCR